MPKIIQNLRDLLLSEAKEQINRHGYAQTTIRSVAQAVGVGVGTVYNYFPSKEMLIAAFMLEDWQSCVLQMQTGEGDVLFRVYNALTAFIQKHDALFNDQDAMKVFASASQTKHEVLRTQIAQIIAPVCENASMENKAFLSEFIAESVLRLTIERVPFAQIQAVIGLLIK